MFAVRSTRAHHTAARCADPREAAVRPSIRFQPDRKAVMQRTRTIRATGGALVAAAVALVPLMARADAPSPSGTVSLTALGTFDGGGVDRAEIVAFDPASSRMFVSNGDAVAVDIVSISDPADPTLVTTFDLTPYGDGVNGVAAYDGLVAAAVEVDPTFDSVTGVATPQNGSVVFFRVDGTFVADVEVGNLPDAVAFSPDGTTLVVSGEGEPICAENVGADEDTDVSLAVDPDGTIGVIDIVGGTPSSTATVLDFSGFNTSTLRAAGVRIFFPGSSAAEDLEPEYAVISADSSTAFVTIQEANAIAVVDLSVPEISAVVPLGTKDFSGLLMDPSDRDGGVNLANWDVQSLYMPDAIDEYTVGGETYLVTANEGDSRDYSCYSEEERMDGLVYDPAFLDQSLIDAAADDSLLGRLKTTTAMPTSSPVDALYAWGGRSFTIWNTSGDVVWDSGSQFEEYIAENHPEYFNTQADDEATPGAAMVASMAAEVDSRSDDKGSEPEAIAVGRIGDRSYAFVGLERQGGIMVYDVTNPSAPSFEDYVNLAIDELDVDGPFTAPGTTDVSPEGVLFVPAADSPTGRPLLLVANELSGTTTVYEVTGSEIDEQLAPPPSTTVPTTTPVTTPTGVLPATGSGPVAALLAGLVVLVGVGLTTVRRRI
jgi:LPXTG-motif cell wall-anchored protein